jgi:hypothetical protein
VGSPASLVLSLGTVIPRGKILLLLVVHRGALYFFALRIGCARSDGAAFLPSADTTIRPVMVKLPSFLTVNSNVWSSTFLSERAFEFGSR